MRKALAFDIGGTKINYGIIDENGQFVGEIQKVKTPKELDEMKNLIQNIVNEYEEKVDVVGFSTAGAVNNENNKVISATVNLADGYADINFQDFSKKKVYVENDANCAAWAEHVIGASKGCAYSVMLTLGTGVGGGIILDNKLYKGKSGGAGEMHFKIYAQKDARRCSCGITGCYEIYCSGTGLKLTAEEMLNDKNVTTYDVVDGLKSGDKKMTEIFNKWQDDILAGLIGLANIFDPECVVFSGSMAEFIDTAYLEKETNSQILTAPTKVYKATTGNYAGMIGAALLALAQ